MDIQRLHEVFLTSSGVSTDSRKVARDNIFFALKGENFDGNKFASDALSLGAKFCVIDDPAYDKNEYYILVDDALKTLQELASYHREKMGTTVIALTGSNGKTTSKELIHAVLSSKFETIATVGNLNNHIGVPLTLLDLKPSTEIGIVEMGANHLDEIAFLCELAKPDYGLVTNFGKAHLEGFGSEENIVKGKSEMYRYLIDNDKTVVANTQNSKQIEVLKSLGEDIEEVEGGLLTERFKLAHNNPFLTLKYNDRTINTQLIGPYNFSNILYAIGLGEHFKVPTDKIISAIENYVPSNNRSQIVSKENNRFILDAYNANPSSMLAALENFSSMECQQRVAILGDMFELGDATDFEHQAILDYALKQDIHQILIVGKHFYKTKSKSAKVEKFKTFDELQTALENRNYLNSCFLIKGSRGMAMERILETF